RISDGPGPSRGTLSGPFRAARPATLVPGALCPGVPVPSLFHDPAFVGGFWQGVFQLLSLSIVALFGNLVYQRIRHRYAAREEIIDEIDQFTISLYRPRKIYQMYVAYEGKPQDLLADIPSPVEREDRRNETL